MDIATKLKIVADAAAAKIEQNRTKRFSANMVSKWPEVGFNEAGERDWMKCPVSFLFDKLDEEVAELKSAIVNGEPLADVLKEAGDVTALAMMIADRAGAIAAKSQP